MVRNLRSQEGLRLDLLPLMPLVLASTIKEEHQVMTTRLVTTTDFINHLLYGRIRQRWFILYTIIGVGLLLRLANADYSYNGDDFSVLLKVTNGSIASTISWAKQTNLVPLYFILLNVWRNLGEGEVFTKLLGIILGTLSIPATYLIGKKLLGESAALLGAFLLAVSPFHIEQAQQLKPHVLLALLSLLSIYWFLDVWDNGRLISLLGYIVCTVVGLYTHYCMAFIILSEQVVFLIFFRKRGRKLLVKWFGAQLWLVLMFLPWLGVLYGQLWSNRLTGLVPGFSRLFAWPELALTFSLGYTAVEFTGMTSGKVYSYSDIIANLPVLIVIVLVFGSASLLGTIRALRRGLKGRILLAFLLFPVISAFALAFVPAFSAFSPKLLIGPSAFYYLLLALSASYSEKQRWVTLIFMGLLLLNAYSLFNFYFRDTEFGRKSNWRGLVGYVVDHTQPGDVIGGGDPLAFEWYYQGNLPVHYFSASSLNASPEAETERVAQTLGSHPRVWYAEPTRSNPDSAQALALRWLQTDYIEVEEVRFNPLLVLHLFQRQEP